MRALSSELAVQTMSNNNALNDEARRQLENLHCEGLSLRGAGGVISHYRTSNLSELGWQQEGAQPQR